MQELALPTDIQEGLDRFVEKSRRAFGADLVSAILFGSAAEGMLRPTSDVNVLLVLRLFEKEQADLVRDALRTAHAAMHLDVMFLLESEIEQAMDAFAVKFADILSRRRVLFGRDPFADLTVPPDAILRRTQQVLLNLILRMRSRYVLISKREEQLALVLSDMIGPLRVCAASILKLEGRPVLHPKGALETIISENRREAGRDMPALIDTMRRQGALPPGVAGGLMLDLIGVAKYMHHRTTGLSGRQKGDGCV